MYTLDETGEAVMLSIEMRSKEGRSALLPLRGPRNDDPEKRDFIGEHKIDLQASRRLIRQTVHMLLTEIDHVAIAVRDLEAAIDYYERAFGATVDHREIVESDGVEEALLKVAKLRAIFPRRRFTRCEGDQKGGEGFTTSGTG